MSANPIPDLPPEVRARLTADVEAEDFELRAHAQPFEPEPGTFSREAREAKWVRVERLMRRGLMEEESRAIVFDGQEPDEEQRARMSAVALSRQRAVAVQGDPGPTAYELAEEEERQAAEERARIAAERDRGRRAYRAELDATTGAQALEWLRSHPVQHVPATTLLGPLDPYEAQFRELGL